MLVLIHQLTEHFNWQCVHDDFLGIHLNEPMNILRLDKKLETFRPQRLESISLTKYLGITQPLVLYLIKRKLGDRVDLKFYKDKERSFHSKSFFIMLITVSYILAPPIFPEVP